MSKRIIVTGANRGIGLETALQLSRAGHQVIMAVRDVSKGKEALRNAGHPRDIEVIPLDISDPFSIADFKEKISEVFELIDVLINNAAILQDSKYTFRTIPDELLQKMLNTNLFGSIRLTQALLPLLDKSNDPRVINISSGMGALNEMGGGHPAYRLSKTSLNSFTAVLAAEEPHIKVNAVCPGWVQTDMGGSGAHRPVEKGAETPVWLATADDIPTGKFWRDKKVIDW